MSGGRLRRAWRHRWVRVVSVTVAVAVVAGVATSGWFAYQIGKVPRVPVDLEKAKPGEPQNFLLVGSDSRAFVDGTADAAAFGTEDEVGEPKADTILLVRTFPELDRVAIVSFPRDLFLPIAGTEGEDRINAAVQQGANQLVETIRQNFGISVHRYAQIDFRGFKGLVNAIGGVEISFPAPARDYDEATKRTLTGLDIPTAGCIRLDGDQALAYVRSRHYQQLVDGQWQPDPAGDLNRIQRQQEFIRRSFHETLSRGLLDPRRVNRLIGVARDNVSLDRALGIGDARRFATQFGSLPADALRTYALPTTPGTTPDGAQVLYLDGPGAEPILDVFRGRTVEPPVLLAGGIRVRVENASGRAERVRAAAAFRLAAAGFLVAGVGDAAPVATTTVRFAPGQEESAALVAGRIAGPSSVVADPSLQEVDVVLTLGRDWQAINEQAPEPPPASTTTTSAAPPTDATGTTTTTKAPVPTC